MRGWIIFGVVSALLMALAFGWSLVLIFTQSGLLEVVGFVGVPWYLAQFCLSVYIVKCELEDRRR